MTSQSNMTSSYDVIMLTRQRSTCIDGIYHDSSDDVQMTTSPATLMTSTQHFSVTSFTSILDDVTGQISDDRPSPSKLAVSSTLLVIYAFVFIFGVVGNALVIGTLRSSPHMRTVTNCFLLSLAISDMLQALICIPISLTGQALRRFIFGSFMCRLSYFIMGISVSVSTFTMLAISLERYHAICKPLKSRGWQTKSHAYKVIGSIWLISIIMMTPYIIFSQLEYTPIRKLQKCHLACRLDFGANHRQTQKGWYVFQVFSLFIIPGILMSISYAKVCRQIYKGFQFHAAATPTQQTIQSTNTIPMKLINKYKEDSINGHYGNNSSVKEKIKSETSIEGNSADSRNKPTIVRQQSKAYQSKKQLESKKRIIRMLIVVVIFFFICWAPLFTANLWKGFDPQGAYKAIGGFISIIQLLSFISCCINPIIYCFMNLKFRQSFVKAFTCCLPQKCADNCIQYQSNNMTSQNSNMMTSINDRTMTSEIVSTPIIRHTLRHQQTTRLMT